MLKKCTLTLVLVLMFSLIGCSDTGISEANQVVNRWNKFQTAGCTYSSEYDASDNTYYVVAKATNEYYAGQDSRLWDAITEILAQEIKENLYPELETALNDKNVDIVIGVYDYSGELYCAIYNGDTQY